MRNPWVGDKNAVQNRETREKRNVISNIEKDRKVIKNTAEKIKQWTRI